MKDKKTNLNPPPKLKKKNGVWVKILIPALCLIAGAGAMAGLTYGVPAVGNLLINQEQTGGTVSPGQTSELQKSLNELKEKLTNSEKLLLQKDSEMQEKELHITKLTEEKTAIQKELEELKKLTEQDLNYFEMIQNLTAQLEEKTTALTSATAELEQLRVDKEQLTAQVDSLTIELKEVKEKLNNYESSVNLDKLQVENYNGTWYKNGTFEDYFVINNGIVTRGNNIENGVIQPMYNEMHMLLNSTGGQTIVLNDNGSKITFEDGTEYTKAAINITENAEVNIGIIAGTYKLNDDTLVLNSDNTAILNSSIYGAYTVTAIKKNVGGNVTYTHNIKVTLNNEESQILNLTLINNNCELLNESNDVWLKQQSETAVELIGGSATYINPIYKTNCYKLTIKTKNPITIENNKNVAISFNAIFDNYYLSAANNYAYINGLGKSTSLSGYSSSTVLYNKTGEIITSDTFTIYLYPSGKRGIQQGMYFTLYNGGKLGSETFNITNIEALGNVLEKDCVKLSDELMAQFVNSTYYKDCNPISDYYTGDFTTSDYSLNLTTDAATITPAAGEPITATEYTVAAKTDGTNIIHTVTLKFLENDTERTLTFELVNNSKELTNVVGL